MKKLLNGNNPENTAIHVTFNGKFNEEYECVGVLVREEKDFIRVAFSAKDDKVTDYVDIKRSDIIGTNLIDLSELKEFQV
jgi:hypothetical protein